MDKLWPVNLTDDREYFRISICRRILASKIKARLCSRHFMNGPKSSLWEDSLLPSVVPCTIVGLKILRLSETSVAGICATTLKAICLACSCLGRAFKLIKGIESDLIGQISAFGKPATAAQRWQQAVMQWLGLQGGRSPICHALPGCAIATIGQFLDCSTQVQLDSLCL